MAMRRHHSLVQPAGVRVSAAPGRETVTIRRAPKPRFFPSPAAFRRWLAAHHQTAPDLLVGFYKKGSGKPSITWPESVDEALAVGWIDGVRRRIDEVSYTIRFSPRRARSIWSAINIRRVQELEKLGRMQPAGLKAFEKRTANRSGIYSYEQRPETLGDPYHQMLAENKAASGFFHASPPWYKRAATWWVISARQEETRLKRLRTLIELSARRTTIPQFTRRNPVARKHASR
jgi:uncharacterized protein YdeI (YjbR/CyaY-like superfamily)